MLVDQFGQKDKGYLLTRHSERGQLISGQPTIPQLYTEQPLHYDHPPFI